MNYLEIKERVAKDFENYQSRYMHMLEVVDMALKINKHFNFNLDEEKIKIVGILHDYTKRYSFEESLEIIKVLPKEEQEIWNKSEVVIHCVTSSIIVKEKFGINDPEMLDAIKYHTTGYPNMTMLAKVLYVADAIEATRVYDGVEVLRKTVFEDFNKGLLLIMETTLKHLKEKGLYINPYTLEAYNYYKEA